MRTGINLPGGWLCGTAKAEQADATEQSNGCSTAVRLKTTSG